MKKKRKRSGSDSYSPFQLQADRKKKETILDLTKFIDKSVRVKFSGGREGKAGRFHLFFFSQPFDIFSLSLSLPPPPLARLPSDGNLERL
jgi:hypothetical protein